MILGLLNKDVHHDSCDIFLSFGGYYGLRQGYDSYNHTLTYNTTDHTIWNIHDLHDRHDLHHTRDICD